MKIFNTTALLISASILPFAGVNAHAQWQPIDGQFKEISVDDQYVWAVTSGQVINRRPIDGSGTWQKINGTVRSASISGDGWVWALQDRGRTWKCQKPCSKPTWVEVGGWPTPADPAVQVTGGEKFVWARSSKGVVYRRPIDGSGKWNGVIGQMQHLSASSANWLFGMNSGATFKCEKPCTGGGKSWNQVFSSPNTSDPLTEISASDRHVFSLSTNDYISYRPIAEGGAWTTIPGQLKKISTSPSGQVWGINATGKVYRMRPHQIPGYELALQTAVPAPTNSTGVAIGDITITSDKTCDEGQRLVKKTTCVAEVYFHKVNLPFETMKKEAAIMARERGWVLATTQDVQSAWKSLGLNQPVVGLLASGGLATPVQQDTPSAGVKRGANIDVIIRHPDGFFYVKETAVSRVQALPVQFVAPDWWPDSPLSTAPGGGLPGSTWRDIPPPTYAGIWSSSQSDQHPAKALFGLGDARMMRSAAREQLKKTGKPTTATAIDAHLQKLRSDPVARYQFAPFLLGEAFEAVSTPNPDAEQAAFRKVFELYMSYESYKVNGITYDRWRDFNGANPYVPKLGYGYGVTAADFLPKIPSADQFMQQNDNSMGMDARGLATIRLLVAPAVAASLPEFKNSPLGQIGADMNAIAAGVAIGSTAGLSAATLGLVSSAVFGYSVVLGATTVVTAPILSATGAVVVAGSSSLVSTTGALTPAALIAKGSLGAGGTTATAGAAIGVVISVAMAALIAKSFADLAKSDALDRELRTTLDAGPQPVDVYSLVTKGSTNEQQINRSAVFSYLLKMIIADPAEKGLLTIKQPKIQPAKITSSTSGPIAPVNGYVRFQNNWYKNAYINNETTKLQVGTIQSSWWSAQWKTVPTVAGFVQIQNRWKPDQYLHNQNGKLEVGPIGDPGWWSAQWRVVPTSDGWGRIQNRWKPDQYIHNQNGRLEVGPIQPNWASAKWKMK